MDRLKNFIVILILFIWVDMGNANPRVLDIEVRAIRNTSVIILWHTDVAAKGYVEYGLTASYGNLTTEEDLGYFQAIKLTGLNSGTVYHYRIRSKDSSGNDTISGDNTFTTATTGTSPIIIGDSPNPSGTTTIDQDTVWEGVTVTCGGNVIVGSASGKINFTIKDSAVTVNGKWTMGGNTPVNFKLENSEIIFPVTAGVPFTGGGVIDTNKLIEVLWTSDISKPSQIELIDSTVRGTSDLYHAWGIKINSGSFGTIAKHTLILDNVTLKWMGGLYNGNAGYALLAGGTYASDSRLINIMLYETRYSLTLGNSGLAVNYATAVRGGVAFYGGGDWQHLAMHKTLEGVYNPADGSRHRNSWFDAGETKFNMPMSGSNLLCENSTIVLAAVNSGAGQWDFQGIDNTLRNNVFIQSSVANYKKGLKLINNIFDRGMPSAGNIPINAFGINHILDGNLIIGGDSGIRIAPHPEIGPGSGHKIKNNIIKNTTKGMRIDSQDNVLFINNSISNTTTYDIDFSSSTNLKFINTKFTELKVRFGDASTVFPNYYYLDVKVVEGGNPVSGATVNITNNVDNTNYPSININGQTKTSTLSGTDGHISLPLNTTDSIAILDYWKNSATKQEMTHTITATRSGKTASISGVNIDQTWYRENPNAPVKTVILDLDTGSGSVETNPSGTISGTVTNTDNNPLPGAMITINSYTILTDFDGKYTITLPTGNYTVLVSKPEYASNSKQVEVIKDAAINLDFVLETSTVTVTSPTITSFFPPELNLVQSEETINVFSVTVDQPVTHKWFLDNVLQSEIASSYTKTWSYSDVGTHTISYTGTNVNGSVSQSWTVTVNDVAKDISQADEQKIKVYPNPYIKGKSAGEKITFGNLPKEATIKIYTSSGQLVKELSNGADGNAEWNISDVGSGVYLYVVSSSEGTKKGKVSIIK